MRIEFSIFGSFLYAHDKNGNNSAILIVVAKCTDIKWTNIPVYIHSNNNDNNNNNYMNKQFQAENPPPPQM